MKVIGQRGAARQIQLQALLLFTYAVARNILEGRMRLRIVMSVVVFFIAAVVLAGIMYGPGLLTSKTGSENSQTPVTSGNPIVLENAHLGTDNWKIPPGKEATTQILSTGLV